MVDLTETLRKTARGNPRARELAQARHTLGQVLLELADILTIQLNEGQFKIGWEAAIEEVQTRVRDALGVPDAT